MARDKWTPDEDALIIELRAKGMNWGKISEQIPPRTALGCRLRYQNYIERRFEWEEHHKTKLALLYERYLHGCRTSVAWGYLKNPVRLCTMAGLTSKQQIQRGDVVNNCGEAFHSMEGS